MEKRQHMINSINNDLYVQTYRKTILSISIHIKYNTYSISIHFSCFNVFYLVISFCLKTTDAKLLTALTIIVNKIKQSEIGKTILLLVNFSLKELYCVIP